MDDLVALPGGELYGRLAVWLLDASEKEIAAFWADYGSRDGRRGDVTELVFLAWTRLDPRGALAAVAGSETESVAWRSWACHDPAAALAAALEAGSERDVAWGIGEFRPRWLRENWAELPENMWSFAAAGLSNWRETEDPLETVEFLTAAGQPVGGGQIAALAREDPWAAVDWFERAEGRVDREALFGALAGAHPEVLKELAARTATAEIRREMEARLFDVLLEADPEAALRETGRVEAPVEAARQQAAIAGRLLDADPERALGLAEELLQEHPSMLNRGLSILADKNRESWEPTNVPEVEALFDRVMVEAPVRMMEAVQVEDWRGGPHTALQNLAGRWAKTDVEALGEWIESTRDIPRRNQAVAMLVEHLNGQVRAPEAAVEWMLAYPDARIQGHIEADAYRTWAQQQPEEALALLGQADAPRNARVYIGQILSEEP